MTSADAPSRESVLTFDTNGLLWDCIWEFGYCGCEDCHCIIGRGKTRELAEADYWEQWEEKYGE